MKVAIYNLEGYTNIALEKIKMYHKSKGDHVEKYCEIAAQRIKDEPDKLKLL